jgi:hypothetical protein
MAAIRTEITEIITGLAMLGFRDLDEALLVRPMSVVNLTTEHYERLDAARQAGTHAREFETAWENGRIFARADDGLRGRPPWTVEWKGPHKPPGYEQVPADLRVDHVYLVSCKYGSSILHNVSPSHLFDRSLAERRVERGSDWFLTTAPQPYQAFYEACLFDTQVGGLPAAVADLDKPDRLALKAALPKRGRLPETSQRAYEDFSMAVATASAERWRTSLRTARERESMLWRLLRLQAAPYFVLGATTSGDPLRYRVGTPWDFRSRYEVRTFDAWPEAAGQPMVRWRADVVERPAIAPASSEAPQLPEAPQAFSIEGHVEIRWTHGRFSGAPEAKVHLDTHPHEVPGYFPLS